MSARFAALLFLSSSLLGLRVSSTTAACDNGSLAAYFRLGTDDATGCYISLHAGMNTIAIYVAGVPMQKAICIVPDLPLGTITEISWLFPHSGDRLTGVELDFGECRPAVPFQIGEIQLELAGDPPTPCFSIPWWWMSGDIMACNGMWLDGGGIAHNFGATGEYCCAGWQFCYPLPPYDLDPPNGATEVPTNVVLTWATTGWGAVDITTDPECGTVQTFTVDSDQQSFAPDFLQPNTTYYWRPQTGWYDMWCGTPAAAFHSFTTSIVTPTEPTTWGRVKALYRN